MCVCAGTCIPGVSPLLLVCESCRSDSGCLFLGQVSLPSEQSLWTLTFVYETESPKDADAGLELGI